MNWAPRYAYWLSSYPKSGNTWVRMLLAAYAKGSVDINKDTAFTAYDADDYTWNALAPHPITDMRPETAVYLRHAVLLHLMTKSAWAPTIIKTHAVNGEYGDVRLIPRPLTKHAVYLVRDPRDVVVSFARHSNTTIDEMTLIMNDERRLLTSANNISVCISTWSNHVKSWEQDWVTRIRYEDLKEDTEGQLAKILEAFDLKVKLSKLRKAIKLCEIERLKSQEARHGFIEKGRHDRFFGQGEGWEKVLTDKQARRICEDHGGIMETLGYKHGTIREISRSA